MVRTATTQREGEGSTVGLFARKGRSAGNRGASAAAPFEIDPKLPERLAQSAVERYGRQDFLGAFGDSVRAVDMLHSLYVSGQFRNRQPGIGDSWIVDRLTASLGAALAMDGDADIADGVREATHRLRAISSALEAAGGNAGLYRGALQQMQIYAPHVNVSDVLWH